MQHTSNTSEIWKPVVGYEGLYEVSNHGRVRSLDREIHNGRGGTRKMPGRVLKASPCSRGRAQIKLCVYGKCKSYRPHNLVAEAFLGPRPEGSVVRHADDDPWNNKVENLSYGTQQENMWDSISNGYNFALNKTHCPRGHVLDNPNLVAHILRRGVRSCLACERTRTYVRRNPHMKEDFKKISDSYYEKITK